MEINIGGTSLAEKAVFAKHLSVMLKSGLTIAEALNISQDSAQGKMKKVLQSVLTSVESGQPLSVAFGRHPKVFTGIFISATQAGETSGTLSENLEHLAEQLEKDKELVAKVKGAGCGVCGDTGFTGRIGVFEVLEMTDGVKELILKNASSDEISAAAKAEGMTTMMEDGINKVLSGATTLGEVLRVTRE